MALDADERDMRRRTHVTIRRVTLDIDPRMHLNTAISALMEMVNDLSTFTEKRGVRPSGRDEEPPAVVSRPETAAVLREAVESLVLLVSPFTPHLAEELWEVLGHTAGVVAAGWPVCDEDAAREESIEIPVQVNGKVRGRVVVAAGAGGSGDRGRGPDVAAGRARTWPASRSSKSSSRVADWSAWWSDEACFVPAVPRAGVCWRFSSLRLCAGGPGKQRAGPHLKRIGVPPFENQSATPDLDRVLADAVRTELQGRGRFAIVQDATGVDAVLTAISVPSPSMSWR